jgi:putative copper export protein
VAVDVTGAFAGFLHLTFAVAWVGGLAWVLHATGPDRVDRVRRFESVAWVSVAVLFGTGVVLMLRDENYPGGLGNWSNLWSKLLVAKHLIVLAMLGLLAYDTLSLRPRLRREPASPALANAQRGLLVVGLLLGVAVLGLTAALLTIDAEP